MPELDEVLTRKQVERFQAYKKKAESVDAEACGGGPRVDHFICDVQQNLGFGQIFTMVPCLTSSGRIMLGKIGGTLDPADAAIATGTEHMLMMGNPGNHRKAN